MRLLTIFGTRPEAIKLAPVLRALREERRIESLVCVTGQHRELLDGALRFFGIVPDFDLDLMEEGQGLSALAAQILERVDGVLAATLPDRVLVQGDTTSAMAAALAAHHRGIPLAHVEAGLRTYHARSPWPEELNRRAIALAADLHFAPTAAARANLLAERLDGEVYVTGNSGIDALHLTLARLERDAALRSRADSALPPLDGDTKLLLATAHRRESLGAPFAAICEALAAVALRGDVEIVFPLHPHPLLRAEAERALAGLAHLHLLPPLDLPCFVRLMQRADLILTDSGGVQEEAVALARPVLVARDGTERCEAVGEGAARIAGTGAAHLAREIHALLDDPQRSARFACRPSLYGDGKASARIVAALLGDPVEEFAADRLGDSGSSVTLAAE